MHPFQLHLFELMGEWCGGLAAVVAPSKEEAAKILGCSDTHHSTNQPQGPGGYPVEFHDSITAASYAWRYKRPVQLAVAMDCGVLEIGYHDG